jgi:hypothetical protein
MDIHEMAGICQCIHTSSQQKPHFQKDLIASNIKIPKNNAILLNTTP